MTIQIELSVEAEARLAAGEQAHGLATEQYAGSLLRDLLAVPATPSGRLTVEEFREMLRPMA